MIKLVKREGVTAKVIYVLNGWNRFSATRDFEEWFAEEYPNEKTRRFKMAENKFKKAADELYKGDKSYGTYFGI